MMKNVLMMVIMMTTTMTNEDYDDDYNEEDEIEIDHFSYLRTCPIRHRHQMTVCVRYFFNKMCRGRPLSVLSINPLSLGFLGPRGG